MIGLKMQNELSRIMRGEANRGSPTSRARLVTRGFAKKIGEQWVLTDDGRTLLSFINRR